MNTHNEHDKMILGLMLKRILSFENKQMNLSMLSMDLETLMLDMENVTEEWSNSFYEEFTTLESINAKMPEIEKKEVDKCINDAVFNLKKLIKEEVKEFLPE